LGLLSKINTTFEQQYRKISSLELQLDRGACWVLCCSDVKYRIAQSTGRFRHTINIFLTDKELPVKVDAAIALQMYLAPQIKEIMMELLNIWRLRITT